MGTWFTKYMQASVKEDQFDDIPYDAESVGDIVDKVFGNSFPSVSSTGICDLKSFIFGYVSALLFTETDENDEPLDSTYMGVDGFAPDAVVKIEADCKKFLEANCRYVKGHEEQAGKDFVLTRNGQGAGFWDGDWEEEAGKILTDASHEFGQMDAYVGDDGLLYVT